MLRSAVLLACAHALTCAAQWTQLVHPLVDRCDDLYFLNADTGWAAGGGSGRILRTYDGGDFWWIVGEFDTYLRSIEFLDAQKGFCGSLDGNLYRSTDGGTTWTDMMDELPQAVPGVCGLCAPDAQTIYGTGVFFGPAHVIKSTDAGTTWQHIDMSAHAWCLIDVLFFNGTTGLVAGGAANEANGASIFRTTDGGATWTEVFNTGSGYEWVWKLQSPDGVHVYASIENGSLAPTRIARSADAGLTWSLDTVSPSNWRLQGIGFLNDTLGWTGDNVFYTSTDGGESWSQSIGVPGFNRFHRVNDDLAFAGGHAIFRYRRNGVGLAEFTRPEAKERVRVHPSPTSASAVGECVVHRRSHARIALRTTEGRLVREYHNGYLEAGTHTYPLDLGALPAGTYWFSLYTNLGFVSVPVVKE